MDRRQQYREQTRQEAKRIALEQLAEDGVAGISVNAIGKRMGVTGPALYRYFANRDALLTELISDAYHDLANQVEQAIAGAASQQDKLRAAANAMRDWAVAEPHRYLLLFGTPVPGYEAPAHTLDAANRTMAAVLSSVGEDSEPQHGEPQRRDSQHEDSQHSEPQGHGELHHQVAEWGERMGHRGLTPRQLHWGLVAWSRMHGHISLEVAGQFTLSGIDPRLLFDAEVAALVTGWAGEP